MRNTNCDASSATMLEVAGEWPALCTAFIAASGDPGAGKGFHEFSGRIWAFCKRNATSF